MGFIPERRISINSFYLRSAYSSKAFSVEDEVWASERRRLEVSVYDNDDDGDTARSACLWG